MVANEDMNVILGQYGLQALVSVYACVLFCLYRGGSLTQNLGLPGHRSASELHPQGFVFNFSCDKELMEF
jgi:hypothetical protein